MSRIPKLIEKHYSLRELSYLIGFNEKWWREWARTGEAVFKDSDGNVIAQPAELAGEVRVPGSCVNAYLARHPYRYDAGISARSVGELRRKQGGKA